MTTTTDVAALADGATNVRRISANAWITLDGVVENPERWSFQYVTEDIGAAVSAGFATSDALLMGRVLYEEWAAYWPNQSGFMAQLMNDFPKYVLTAAGTHADWANTTIITGADPVDAIRDLTQQPGKDIAVSGSPTVVRWLLDNDLLDELRLFVVPLVLGSGKRLFPGGSGTVPLSTVRSSTFSNGVLDVTYRKAES